MVCSVYTHIQSIFSFYLVKGDDLTQRGNPLLKRTSLVVQWKTPSKAVGAVSTPGQEAQIPQGSQPKQKQYCNKSNKDLKKEEALLQPALCP